MENELNKLREIFVADDVDAETQAENLAIIAEWEKSLSELDDFGGWKTHSVTRAIVEQARKTYVDASVSLATSRDLSDETRRSLWAKQDAMMWIINLSSRDIVAERTRIETQIRNALNM